MRKVLAIATALVGMVLSVSSDGGYALADGTIQDTVAAGSDNGYVYVYDKAGTPLWNYDTGVDVASLAVSADGAYIAVGSLGNKLYLFDRGGTKLWEEPVPVSYGGNWVGEESKSVAISADGEYVVAGGTDNLYVYKKDGTLHWSHAGAETCVGISPSGDYVVSANKADGTVDFFSVASGTPLWSKNLDAFWVATSDPGYVAVGEHGNDVSLYDSDSAGTEIWRSSHAKWDSDYIRVDMQQDGSSVVAVNDDPGAIGCVLAYFNDLEDGTPGWSSSDGLPSWTYVPIPDLGTNDYYTVAISANGEIIATGPAQGTVVLSRTGPPPLQKFAASGTQSIDLTASGDYGAYGDAIGGLSYFSRYSSVALWSRPIGGLVHTVAVAGPARPVGGIAEFPAAEGEAAVGGPGSSSVPYAALAGVAAAAVVVLAAGGWYARRRWRTG